MITISLPENMTVAIQSGVVTTTGTDDLIDFVDSLLAGYEAPRTYVPDWDIALASYLHGWLGGDVDGDIDPESEEGVIY